tara:strand:- start:52 stop:663 length:612 start_codon:yes stop_codon:yes gene_type:complete
MLYTTFSVPILHGELNIDASELRDGLVIENNACVQHDYIHPETFRVLEKYPGIKLALLNKFYELYQEAFAQKIDHIITTSWVAYHKPGQVPGKHFHTNCTWAGIWYFDEYPRDQTGALEISNPLHDVVFNNLLSQRQIDILVHSFAFQPAHGAVLFFPAQLKHQVLPSTQERYSLAFNLIEDFSNCEISCDSSFKPHWLVNDD